MEQNNIVYIISNWVTEYLKKHSIISEMFLIGSILNREFEEINDVDILQKLNECQKTDLLNYSSILIQLKNDFQMVFQKSLHITIFTSNETNTFDIFVAKNKKIKLR